MHIIESIKIQIYTAILEVPFIRPKNKYKLVIKDFTLNIQKTGSL